MKITLRGLRVSPRCSVTKASPNATTGRWSGKDAGWMLLWRPGGSVEGRVLTSVDLGARSSPGVCTALRIITVLSTTSSLWRYQHLHLTPTGLGYIWTGQGAPCPSTVSHLGPSVIFIHSAVPSLSHFTLGLGWRRMTAL